MSCVRQDSHESSAAAVVIYNSILKESSSVKALIFQSAVFAATFNKASQQTPFVSDNIIQLTDDDACSVCSGVFSKSSQIKLLGFEHGLWRQSCSILRGSQSLHPDNANDFQPTLPESLFDWLHDLD